MSDEIEYRRGSRRDLPEENLFPELAECDDLLSQYGTITRFLACVVGCLHTAADLAQETFVHALRYYGAKTPPTRPREPGFGGSH